MWLVLGIRPNVRGPEFLIAVKRELSRDSLDRTDTRWTIEGLTQLLQTTAVHEHDTVHELDAMGLANIEDLLNIGGRQGCWFFRKDVLAMLGGGDNPLLAKSRRQRDINRIDVLALKESLVRTQGHRGRLKGAIGLAFIDKSLRRSSIAACHYRDDPLGTSRNRPPIFFGDPRRGQNPPSTRIRLQRHHGQTDISLELQRISLNIQATPSKSECKLY